MGVDENARVCVSVCSVSHALLFNNRWGSFHLILQRAPPPPCFICTHTQTHTRILSGDGG